MADGRVSPPKLHAPPRVLIIENQMLIDNLVDDIVSELPDAADGVLTWDTGAGVDVAVPFADVVRNFATALTAARTNSRSQFFLSVVAGPVQWTLRVRQPTWRRVPAGQ